MLFFLHIKKSSHFRGIAISVSSFQRSFVQRSCEFLSKILCGGIWWVPSKDPCTKILWVRVLELPGSPTYFTAWGPVSGSLAGICYLFLSWIIFDMWYLNIWYFIFVHFFQIFVPNNAIWHWHLICDVASSHLSWWLRDRWEIHMEKFLWPNARWDLQSGIQWVHS